MGLKQQEMHASIGTEDQELERALNFNTVSVASRDEHDEDQMVPERDSSNPLVDESNEDYFNQWISSFKK